MMNSFAFYGLDTENNFLQAPICECGCGKYLSVVLESDDDVFEFMYAMLEEYECEHCGIFAFKASGVDMLIGLKVDGEILFYDIGNIDDIKGYLAGVQRDLRLHCYGILEQIDEDLYRIVMD